MAFRVKQFYSQINVLLFTRCFGLAWINARCPPKPLYHSPSSAGQGRGNMKKGSWVKGRERSLTNFFHRQNRLKLGRKGKFDLSPIKPEQDSEK